MAILRVADGSPLEGWDFVEPSVLPPPCFDECCGVCGGVEIRLAGWVSDRMCGNISKMTRNYLFSGSACKWKLASLLAAT